MPPHDLVLLPLHDRRLRLAERHQELARLCRSGRLAATMPVVGDEEVLDQMGRSRDISFPAVQAWLAREHLAARGCYADPTVRNASALCRVITAHARHRLEHPAACAGTIDGCHGCAVCADDDHRRTALASMAIGQALALLRSR
ncbi:hypothetical protein ACFVXG_38545 [Kitasatospora sp. NPDC058162]|uniref:hypothetical protein n=1 Tax=Kitasatospora sp. NPDC058162 TaxID=3346362 RepID=UPI0036DBD5CE